MPPNLSIIFLQTVSSLVFSLGYSRFVSVSSKRALQKETWELFHRKDNSSLQFIPIKLELFKFNASCASMFQLVHTFLIIFPN